MVPLVLLFDADGVLVDSEPIVNRVLAEMLRELGLDATPDQMDRLFKGSHITETVAHVEVELGRATPPDFVPEFRRRSAEAFQQDLVAVDGVHEAIRQLAEIPRAVVSNGPQEKMAVSLELTGLVGCFESRLIFSAYDIEAWKPDPALFLHAARALGADPVHCVVIEDSVVGLEAAHAAGMRALAYHPGPGRPRRAWGATVFQHMEELPGLVRELVGSGRW